LILGIIGWRTLKKRIVTYFLAARAYKSYRRCDDSSLLWKSKHISKRFSAELHGEFTILTVESIKGFHQTPPFTREPIIPKASL